MEESIHSKRQGKAPPNIKKEKSPPNKKKVPTPRHSWQKKGASFWQRSPFGKSPLSLKKIESTWVLAREDRAALASNPKCPLPHRAGLGWAELLGWANGGTGLLGWAGLGWAGLGWAGLGWAGLCGLGWAGLGWAGLGWGCWGGV